MHVESLACTDWRLTQQKISTRSIFPYDRSFLGGRIAKYMPLQSFLMLLLTFIIRCLLSYSVRYITNVLIRGTTKLETVHLPRADQWVRGEQFFRQTNGPIAKISQNEGSLHLGVCFGCLYIG